MCLIEAPVLMRPHAVRILSIQPQRRTKCFFGTCVSPLSLRFGSSRIEHTVPAIEVNRFKFVSKRRQLELLSRRKVFMSDPAVHSVATCCNVSGKRVTAFRNASRPIKVDGTFNTDTESFNIDTRGGRLGRIIKTRWLLVLVVH